MLVLEQQEAKKAGKKKAVVETEQCGWEVSINILNTAPTHSEVAVTVANEESTMYREDAQWIISKLSAKQVKDAAECCYVKVSERERALKTVARYLAAENGDRMTALSKLQATLEWRNSDRVSVHKLCNLQKGDELARKMEVELGPNGRLCVRGRDKAGRAIMHCVTRFSRRDGIQDKVAYVQSHCLIFERAVAASEQHGQIDLIVAVDISDFAMWQIPTAELTRELIHMANAHYPERLYKVYVIDAPRLFRVFWMLVKPFLDPTTRTKYEFVTGARERERILGSTISVDQAMPYMLSGGELKKPWDVEHFLYDVDFDKAYDEK